MEKGNKPEVGYGEMPPAYSAQYPPQVGYMKDPPPNAAPFPSPPPGAGFATAQSMYAQQAPYVGQHQHMPPVVQVVQFSNLRSRSTRLVSTRVSYRTGRFTHLAALVLCLICCPCGIVPYCLEECQDAEHYCPNCQQFIGIYRR